MAEQISRGAHACRDISHADRNFAMQPFVLSEPMWQGPVPTHGKPDETKISPSQGV